MPQNITCEFIPFINVDLDELERVSRQIMIRSKNGVTWNEAEKGHNKAGKPYLRIKATFDEVVSLPEFFEALWNKILAQYVGGYDEVERRIIENMSKGVIVFKD